MEARRFPIRFTGASRAMCVLGLCPSNSWVELPAGALRVRMGWAFRLDVPRASVREARPDGSRTWSRGVHGWRGRWLVNGSSSGLVRIDLEPPARASMGPIPITVRELRVSVVDPDDLAEALATRP